MFDRRKRMALLMAQAKEHVKELAAPMQKLGIVNAKELAAAMFWAGRLSGLSSAVSNDTTFEESMRAEGDCTRLTEGVPRVLLSDCTLEGEVDGG